MALSLSPAARNHLKNFLICFSLANLCFLRRWYNLENLKERAMDYYRAGPQNHTLLLATALDGLLLTLVFWLAWLWVERDPTAVKLRIARCGFLLTFIYPLESVRLYWNQEGTHRDLASNLALLAIEAVLAVGAVLAIFGNTRIVAAARRVALALTLLLPALLIDFGFSSVSAEPPSAYQAKPSAPLLPPRPGPQRRVVWILFDELDQHLVFDLRQPQVDLPEFDRLRAQALVATRAAQTAGWTTQALPSLLSGEIYSAVQLKGASEMRVYGPGAPNGMEWGDAPNVFRKARALGLNAALVGWHHPYCREIGDSLVRCMDVVSEVPTAALVRESAAKTEGLAATMRSLFKLQLLGLKEIFSSSSAPATETVRDQYIQRLHQQQFFRIRDRAYMDIADPQLDFVFVHFPVPHPFGIYDRRTAGFQLKPTLGYVDNLALVDRTIGEMRSTLERAGLWDSTSILITSDHGLRPDLWKGHLGWTPELETLTGGKQSETVPFIVRLAGDDHAATYDRPFSNVVCGDLSLAIISGQVRTSQDAVRWLDASRASQTPSGAAN